MPKIKSLSGAAKRFRKTSSGKFKRAQSFRRHILTSKTTKHKRHLRAPNTISMADTKLVSRMLPYS